MNTELVKLAYKLGHEKAINDFTKTAGLLSFLGKLFSRRGGGGMRIVRGGLTANQLAARNAGMGQRIVYDVLSGRAGAAAPATANPSAWAKFLSTIRRRGHNVAEIWKNWYKGRLANGAAVRSANRRLSTMDRDLARAKQNLERQTGKINTLQDKLNASQGALNASQDALNASQRNTKIMGSAAAAAVLAGLYGMNRQEMNNLREWKYREGNRVDQFARRPW